ncbi:MAG TPA: hypothetical protein VEJ63_07295 [Planctomycetota bacterium]|nr:hypothetical protein [Planctomycetota bacterium]
MAKSKEKKPKPKPPEGVKSVQVIRDAIKARKERLAKVQETAKKDGKVNKYDPKVRAALKRVKRAQRKLQKEAYRLLPKKAPVAAAAEAKPAEAAPAAEEKK